MTNRAITPERLFRDDDDRRTFIRFLTHWTSRIGAIVHAWALLDTHYHQVLQTPQNTISTLIQRVESDYGHYYNDRYGRRGHLVQDRFKSNIVRDEEEAGTWIGYTHANIVDARIATLDTLLDYPWCSHGALLGAHSPILAADPTRTLALLSPNPADARALLRKLTEDSVTRMRARRESRDAQVVAVVQAAARGQGVDAEDVFAGLQHAGVVRARRDAIRKCLALGMTDRAVAASMQLALRTIRRVQIVHTHAGPIAPVAVA